MARLADDSINYSGLTGQDLANQSALTATQIINSNIASMAAPAVAAPAAPVYAQNPNTGYVEGGSQPLTPAAASAAASGAVTVVTPPPPPAPKTPATPTVTPPSGRTVSQVLTGINAQGYDYTTTVYSDGTSSTTTSTSLDQGVQQGRQSVFDTVNALFTSYGVYKNDPVTGQLDTASQQLQKTINDLAMSGASQDAITLTLQTSQAYMTRFSGNTARLKAGLNVLSPADYLNYENQVTGMMKDAGLPAQYYTQSAIGNLIGSDLSTSEVASRVSLAQASVANADPYYTTALQNYYGISPTQMVAHVLDPTISSTLLQEQVGSSQIGAEAARQGLANTVANSQYLYGAGVSQSTAQTGYGKLAAVLPAATNISNIYGNQTGLNYNQQTGEQQYLLNNGQAALTQQKLNQYETANFQGQSGINPGVQALRKSMQGQF
jgi:hypothetical protein